MSIPQRIALAVIFHDGKVLVARRPKGKRLGGLWEFPGGKIEDGESAAQAAERECREEIGCEVSCIRSLGTVRHDYGDFSVELVALLCELNEGENRRSSDATELEWATLEDLKARPIPAANHALIEVLRKELQI